VLPGVVRLKQTTERRKAVRVPAQLAVQLSGGPDAEHSTTSETVNISEGGMYLKVPHPIEILTKLETKLVLPIKNRRGQVKSEVVNCTSVVVRCDKEPPDYRIACYFLDIDRKSKELIRSFVEERSPS
jgi:c-di-GMP-binding flagellar brake protein YcgR